MQMYTIILSWLRNFIFTVETAEPGLLAAESDLTRANYTCICQILGIIGGIFQKLQYFIRRLVEL